MGLVVGAALPHGSHPGPAAGQQLHFGGAGGAAAGYSPAPQGLQGLPRLRPQEDEEAEEGKERSKPCPGTGVWSRGGAGCSTRLHSGCGGAGGGRGRLCLQGGDWNSLKQLFNDRSGARRAPCRNTRPPERLPVFAAASHPGHTAFPTLEKQAGSESSLLPEQPRACAATGAAQPAGCPPSCPPPVPTSGPCAAAVPAAGPPQGQPAALLPRSPESCWRALRVVRAWFCLCNF